MKNHILISIAVIVILLSSIFVSCAKPAEFTVVDLSLEPAEIVAGAPSTASAKISNTGGTEGTYSAVLVINGEKSETKSVLINPGGTEVVTFTISRPTPGRYEVAIGSQKQTLTVKLSTAKEIVANAVVASATWDTCKYDMDMSTLMEVVGGTQSGKVAMTVAGTAIMDNTRKEMQMVMNMKIGASGQMNLATKTELYAVGGWMYMNVGGLWMKSRLTDQLWQSQQSQLYQQTEFLRTAVDVKLLGTDNLSGTLCHTVEITPNLGALTDWLSKQQTEGTTGPDFGKLNLNEVIKKMSIKEWIAKDSYRIMQGEVGLLMEVPGGTATGQKTFDKMTMDMNVKMKFYDQNKPVSIIVPQEAKNAVEMPATPSLTPTPRQY